MKKIIQFALVALALLLAGYSANLRAEDIDIYVDNASTAGVPNVLFVIDNGANFSANAKIGCSSYAGSVTEPPSTGTSTGSGILQCALVDAINSLPDKAMNIGVLVSNANNFANDTRSPSDKGYHEKCATDTGGCVVRKLTLMTSDVDSSIGKSPKQSLVEFIKSWKTSGQNDANSFNVKVNSALPGTMMQEAWAYYNGKVGMSGTNYGTSLLQTGCQRNFIIYIANTEKTPAGESPSPFDGANGLTSAQVGATAAQKEKIKERVNFNPDTCGVSFKDPGSQSSDWSENWADEWARLMFQQDQGMSVQDGTQNIVTYSIGITNDATCTPDYPALLSTMAKYGGSGTYLKTSNASELVTALAKVLNEVQAVNSVFSSASLPVSVNAEGSYLNQIFLGMFRPDSSANPRWMGNLKQYQLVKNSSGTLVMGDKNGNPAISSSGTGFVTPTAVSIWTSKDLNVLPDAPPSTPDSYGALGGFFRADPVGTPPSGYDSPDGEVVEKGGVAQQLRKANLAATFTGADGSTTNPRKLYTYCPTGVGCQDALTDDTNEFSTANTGITSGAFGGSSTAAVLSIVRSGTSATVTTVGNHGLASGTSVTIANANQPEYNRAFVIGGASGNTFTISGLPDWPTSPAGGSYTVSVPGGSSVGVTTITRTTTSAGTGGKEIATVTTGTSHGLTALSRFSITGVTGSGASLYMAPTAVKSIVSATSFTYEMDVDPHAGNALNTFTAQLNSSSNPPLVKVSLNPGGGGKITGSAIAGSVWVGQTLTVSNALDKFNAPVAAYNNLVITVKTIGATDVTFDSPASFSSNTAVTATLTPDYTPRTITLSRSASSAVGSTVATAAGLADYLFANGKKVDITMTGTGSAPNESAYVASNVAITCSGRCNSFTYGVTPLPPATAAGTVSLTPSGVSAPATSITRSGTTATVVTASSVFINGDTVSIAPTSGTAPSSEAAYVNTWKVSCVGASPCGTFTIGPVALTPETPATGTNIQAYTSGSGPDKDGLIKWVRGMNNQGDEKAPFSSVTVRPSVHGDVLHSRPLVINYGDSRGIVVFYGTNDGVFRAVNGNESASIGSVPAGGELWGLILREHFSDLNRIRVNAPELKFPSTFLSTAQPKNYFVDGPTGAYQKLKADGTIDKAYLFLTMRRGGQFIYALDVSDPANPQYMWKRSNLDTGFEELGQTWSRPRLTLLQNYGPTDTNGILTSHTPVLVFGAGYDVQEDYEPPRTDGMGRGVFVINALNGNLVWSAGPACITSSTCVNVPEMKYAVPSDVSFVDRDNNGYVDKFYFGDLGGNVWRADVADASPSNWKMTRVAALGCSSGACASGTTPRKFFYPPSVLSVRPAGAGDSYDLVGIVSGDREHPLKNLATGSAYNTADKFFVVKDLGTTLGAPSTAPSTSDVVLSNLVNGTSAGWNGTGSGFYINFATGEKSVNAPLAVNGDIFFATNKPIDRTQTCVANLGEARAYAVNPFTGKSASKVLQGGGLPPSAVSGLITITTEKDGKTSTELEKFCIGCGIRGSDDPDPSVCKSALENCDVGKSVAKNLRRTYWYKK